MKELTDEILNKYIDNELTISEVNELKEYIQNHPEELKKFKAHNLVDNVLRELTPEKAPSNFTEKLMGKIAPVTEYYHSKSSFIKIILFIFALFITGFIAAGFLTPAEQSNNSSILSERLNKLIDWTSIDLSFITNAFSNYNFMILFSSVILILFISLFILVNSHKHFKQEIENIPR